MIKIEDLLSLWCKKIMPRTNDNFSYYIVIKRYIISILPFSSYVYVQHNDFVNLF